MRATFRSSVSISAGVPALPVGMAVATRTIAALAASGHYDTSDAPTRRKQSCVNRFETCFEHWRTSHRGTDLATGGPLKFSNARPLSRLDAQGRKRHTDATHL